MNGLIRSSISAALTAFVGLALVPASQAGAAEVGIILVPRNISQLRPADFIDGVEDLKRLKTTVNLALFGGNELESSPGRYAVEERLGGYNYIAATLQPRVNYLGVSLINTTRRDIASDLETLSWSDPRMLQRFSALLDRIATTLKVVPTQFLIGNEVDVYFESRSEELVPYLEFFRSARELVLKKYPHAQVGISVTYEGLTKARGETIRKVIDASDAAFFTYYPLSAGDHTPQAYARGIDLMLKAAGAKPVLLQEVGFSTSPGGIATPAEQEKFFRFILPAIEREPRISVAAIFALHDIDPPLCGKLVQYYGFGATDKRMKDVFSSMICSLGLKTSDGRPKPAWAYVSKLLQDTAFGSR